MNDNPHLLAIIESKMAQLRTSLAHNSDAKAKSLLAEVQIYTSALHSSL